MTGRPRVSVVIPVYNGRRLLERCLHELGDPSPEIEVIVVDNASDEHIDLDDILVIRNETNRGYAAACNQGAAKASAPFLLFLNSDALIDPGTLSSLLSAAERDHAAAIWQPVIVSEDETILDSAGSAFTGTGFLWHLTQIPKPRGESASVFAVKGACLLVRSTEFDSLAGFDEDYFAYFEDSDLCWRARLMGWEVRVVPGCRVRHRGGATTTAYFRPSQIDYLSFRNRLRSILCNASSRTLARVLPLHVAACLAAALAFAARGRPGTAWAILRALGSTLPNRSLRSKRLRVQSERTRTDAEVLRPGLVIRMTPHRAVSLLAAYLPRWQR